MRLTSLLHTSNARRSRRLSLTLLPVLLLLLASQVPVAQAASHATANVTLELIPTYESMSVYLSFDDDDDGDNSATMEYRQVGAGSFITGMDMVVDRRDIVQNDKTKLDPNPFKNQWRASLLGLQAGTDYEVQVTVSDPDGGDIVVTETMFTWTETALIPSTGNTFYVSDADGSDGDDGSESNPWKTMQNAVDSVSAGDTILVKAGTYNENVTIDNDAGVASGTPSNYITLRNFQSDIVTIQLGGSSTDRGNAGINVNASYWRVKGFTIQGGNTGMRAGEDSTNLIFEDNFINGYGDKGAGIELGGLLTGSSFSPDTNVKNITVQNNIIHVDTVQNQDRGGIESLTNKGGHVIRDNTVKFLHGGAGNHGEDCIIHIENLEYDDGWKDTDIYRNVCDRTTDDGIELDGMNVNLRVWENLITGSNVGFSIGPSMGGPTYIFRNTVYDIERWWSLCIGIKYGRGSSGEVFFYHNTFHMRGSACDNKGLSIADFAGPRSSGVHLRNNIFWFPDRGIAISDAAADDLDSDYNLWYDEGGGTFAKYDGASYSDISALRTGTGFEINGIVGNPLFADPDGLDWTLEPGSPAIDAGVIIQGFNDLQSAWPYSGGAPDMGRFEVGTADTSAPVRSSGQPSGSQASDTTQVTMSLSTNEQAICKYSGTSSTAFDSMPDTFTNTSSTSHTTDLTGLTSGSSYTRYVRCEDSVGNENTDDFAISFDIPSPDVTTPVISGIAVVAAPTSATVSWDTDDASDSKVSYGTAPGTLD